MRKHLCGILAAVFLCMWKAEKTDADPNTNMILMLPFSRYNDCDLLYNEVNVRATETMRKNAEAYAKENPHPIVGSDYIMKQHIYLSAIRMENRGENHNIMRSAIMFNFFLTFEAYSAAVNFRVCNFFYRYDLCTIKNFFTQKPNKPLKAEYVCKLLKKLNLNFLRFPGDQTSIDLLQDDENNIYKSDKLTLHDLETGEKSFISIFEKYRVPKKEESEDLGVYHNRVHYEIWNLISDAYTDKYSVLFSYFYQVITKTHHPILTKPAIQKFTLKKTWDKVLEFYGTMNLPTDAQRGVVYEGNTIGSVIYRSNAVEILRQISYYFVYPKLIEAGSQVYDIMTIINDGRLKRPLIVAPENLSVDYCFDIDPIMETIPLLNH